MPRRIVVVGSLNLDLVFGVPRRPTAGETIAASSFATHLGGKGANQAVTCARLGLPVTMIGRVGEDSYGTTLLDGLSSSGVDSRGVQRTPGSSGLACILTDPDAANSIMIVGGANAALSAEDVLAYRDLIAGAGVVLAQLETPLASVIEAAKLAASASVPFLLDPAPASPLPAELLRRVTWLTPNESESQVLSGLSADATPQAIAEKLLQKGCRNVVLKLGAEGVFLIGADLEARQIAGFRVQAVDTTAAGDAFNGAFAAGLCAGLEPAVAAELGCAVAALSVTRAGAQSSLPTGAELQEFLRQQRPGLLHSFEQLLAVGSDRA